MLKNHSQRQYSEIPFFALIIANGECLKGFYLFLFMSKTKSNKTPHYELLYIVSNKYSEDELKPIIAKVNKLVEDNDGKITHQEEWGKKKFAYPIQHFNYGYYNLLEFESDGEKLKKINKELRIDSDILRFQIVAKKIKTEEEIKQAKRISEKIAVKSQEKEKLEKERTKGKVNLKDLEEKLDKILETDDLL